jgi:hypothetical protein
VDGCLIHVSESTHFTIDERLAMVNRLVRPRDHDIVRLSQSGVNEAFLSALQFDHAPLSRRFWLRLPQDTIRIDSDVFERALHEFPERTIFAQTASPENEIDIGFDQFPAVEQPPIIIEHPTGNVRVLDAAELDEDIAQDDCPICQIPLGDATEDGSGTIVETRCNGFPHRFHDYCLRRAFAIAGSGRYGPCPMCRTLLRLP